MKTKRRRLIFDLEARPDLAAALDRVKGTKTTTDVVEEALELFVDMKTSKRKLVAIDIAIRPKLDEALARLIKRTGRTPTDVVEQALEELLNRLEPTTDEIVNEKVHATARLLGVTDQEVIASAIFDYAAKVKKEK